MRVEDYMSESERLEAYSMLLAWISAAEPEEYARAVGGLKKMNPELHRKWIASTAHRAFDSRLFVDYPEENE